MQTLVRHLFRDLVLLLQSDNAYSYDNLIRNVLLDLLKRPGIGNV